MPFVLFVRICTPTDQSEMHEYPSSVGFVHILISL